MRPVRGITPPLPCADTRTARTACSKRVTTRQTKDTDGLCPPRCQGNPAANSDTPVCPPGYYFCLILHSYVCYICLLQIESRR